MKVDFSTPSERIIDLACGFNHCVALNDNKQVYVWGKRMGLYPKFDFSREGIENVKHTLLSEYNNDTPRMIKDNLIFYKIAKIRAGQSNTGLITETGDLLLHGQNDHGQLGLGNDKGKELPFFGDFMKMDFFYIRGLKIQDVSFGSYHNLVLCKDTKTQAQRVFGCG